ncbi:GNAT family N-acetyltransferase [Christiangramia echinicola]|uniref:GNAT family N-acetyltransferase n=1 Tax=Christiangramia echinicola TaxID=279359 RepID=UPI0003F58E84|nr:GNAT family N-acetyltransferase [Christiangramia echinicola]
MNTWKIREIKPEDNQQVKDLIRNVLVEMGVPKVGTAYEDKALDDMTSEYQGKRQAYFVVEENSKIIGGAGIAPLTGLEEKVCELQKMYFLPEARGRGIGTDMINKCLQFGSDQKFKKCYIETLPYMENARKLYNKSGFEVIEKPLGNTGHYNCTVFMIKDLELN